MENLIKKIDLKTLRIVGVLWLIAIVLSVGYCMGKTEKAVGMQVFDLRLTGYSFEYATEFVNNASQETLDFYKNVGIPVDFFLAFFLGVFPIVCFAYMSKKIKIPKILLFLPLGIWLFDSIENVLLMSILGDGLTKSIVSFASITTILKNIIMLPTYIVLLVYTFIYRKSSKK